MFIFYSAYKLLSLSLKHCGDRWRHGRYFSRKYAQLYVTCGLAGSATCLRLSDVACALFGRVASPVTSFLVAIVTWPMS
jgi:hypothetical protein